MDEREERERKRWPEEPETFEDEEVEGADAPRASRGRFRIVLLGCLLLAAIVIGVPYLRGWWSRLVSPPAPSQAVKSEPTPPPAPGGAPAEAPKAATPSLAAPAPAAPIATPTPAPAKGAFWVQVGAFSDPKNAERLGGRLTAERYPVAIRPSESRAHLVVVQVGAYPDRHQAEAARVELEKEGFTGFVLREKRQ